MKLFGKMLFSIGAMKAGTSWLFEMLKSHPDIDTVPIKEIHYFWDLHGTFRLLTFEQRKAMIRYHLSSLLQECSPTECHELLDWFKRYLSDPVDDTWFANLFAQKAQKRYCAEFSNMYAVMEQSGWNHVRTLCDQIRIIYLVRNPLERMWSHARFHALITGRFDHLSSWDKSEYETYLDESGCIVHGAYSTVISTLRSNFDTSEYYIGTYELISQSPIQLLRGIESFLGIRSGNYPDEKLSYVHSPTRVMRMPSAFLQAAEPFVSREIDALRCLGLSLPEDWG